METKSVIPELSARTRGWLQSLHRKATTPDDWSKQGQPHEWWNVYNRPNLSKFDQPTLEGVDYPALSISRAFHDQEESALHIGTYAGWQGDRGANTSFCAAQRFRRTRRFRCAVTGRISSIGNDSRLPAFALIHRLPTAHLKS